MSEEKENLELYTDGTCHMICPYCGYTDTDDWEIENDGGSTQCISCGKDFEYERITTVSYSTWKPGENTFDYITGAVKDDKAGS